MLYYEWRFCLVWYNHKTSFFPLLHYWISLFVHVLLGIFVEQTCVPFNLWQVSPWADSSVTYFVADILLQMCQYVHSCWFTSVLVCTSVCSCVCVWRMYVGVCLQTSVFVSVICECPCISVPLCVFAWMHRLFFGCFSSYNFVFSQGEGFMYLQKYTCAWLLSLQVYTCM